MKAKWKLKNYLLISVVLFLCSCELIAKENAPYVVNAEFVIDESEDYEIAGLNLFLKNKSEKQISKFTLVFFLFDQEGNPLGFAQSSIVLEVQAEVDPLDSISTCINLDKFMYEIPEEPYVVDYVYLSKIEYIDGTEWKDSFGMRNF